MSDEPFELTPEMRLATNPVQDNGGNPKDKTNPKDWGRVESYLSPPARVAHAASNWKPFAIVGIKTLATAFAFAGLATLAVVYERGRAPEEFAQKAWESVDTFVKNFGARTPSNFN